MALPPSADSSLTSCPVVGSRVRALCARLRSRERIGSILAEKRGLTRQPEPPSRQRVLGRLTPTEFELLRTSRNHGLKFTSRVNLTRRSPRMGG